MKLTLFGWVHRECQAKAADLHKPAIAWEPSKNSSKAFGRNFETPTTEEEGAPCGDHMTRS